MIINTHKHNSGVETSAIGEASHAEGFRTSTVHDRAHAEGDHTVASWRAHAEGGYTKALGSHSHAEGAFSQALGSKSHAEGCFFHQVLLKNDQAVVLAQDTEVTDENQNPALVLNMTIDDVLSEGDLISLMYYDGSEYYGSDTREVVSVEGNIVRVNYTFNEMQNCSIPLPYPSGTMIRQAFPVQAIGGASHAEGTASISKGDHSHAEGYPQTEEVTFPSPIDTDETLTDKVIVQPTTAEGIASHAEGMGTRAAKAASHAEGQSTIALGSASHAEGGFSEASGSYSHAEGYSVKSAGSYSHAEGNFSEAIGAASHAEGNETQATKAASHAEGNKTKATGKYSHAEGNETQAIGDNGSHAEGHKTQAYGTGSHAEGNASVVNTGAIAGHAEGTSTVVNARDAHSEGSHTIASSPYQHVQGKYNEEDSNETYAHIVGNGTSNSNRSNAHTLDWNGNAWFAGKVTVENTTPTAPGDLTSKEYVDSKVNNYIIVTDSSLNDDGITLDDAINGLSDGEILYYAEVYSTVEE